MLVVCLFFVDWKGLFGCLVALVCEGLVFAMRKKDFVEIEKIISQIEDLLFELRSFLT